MSNVFLPFGGSGGKNRGAVAVLGDDTPFTSKGSIVSLPLPAGNYKKSTTSPRSDYGDGKNSEVTISKELLKKMAIESFGIGSITNFSLSMYGHKQVQLTWKNPSVGLWSGARFVFKYGSLPESISDSFFIFDSDDVHFEKAMPEERELFVRVFNYVTVNGDRWYDNGDVSAKINVTGISGSVTLSTGSGTWTVPEGVRRIRYILVGNGGRGGGIGYNGENGAGGGGGYFKQGYMNVTPDQSIKWTIPAADMSNQLFNSDINRPVFDTVFGDERVECGRNATIVPYYREDSNAGNGGSGGGGPHVGSAGTGSPGGSDGSDGVHGTQSSRTYPSPSYAPGGTGQHTSTRGFNGVLYCGGGGGGGASGGAGGGGKGAHGSSLGERGTDGLGGGGGGTSYRYSVGGTGGTGCIYIAWGSLMNDGT